LGDIPVLGFLFSRTKQTKRKSNLLLILTPHVIREQSDLRRIFERKMQERQEFLDRYFVFQTNNWAPPTDYTRANGLVEAIRQAYFEVDERKRLEEELRPRELHDHTPSDPIDLPAEVKAPGGGKKPGARPAPPPRPAPKPQKRGALDSPELDSPELDSSESEEAPLRTASAGENVPLRIAPLPRSIVE
jgi:general secretion pathway protein D